MGEKNIDQFPLTLPQPGTWPPTQAGALTGNRTSDILVCGTMANPLSHTSQGHRPLCLHLCDEQYQSVIRAQSPDIWRTGSYLPILSPASCVQAAAGAHTQLTATGVRVAGGRLLLWWELKLTESNCNLPSKASMEVTNPQYSPRFPKSCVRQILPEPLLSRCGDGYLVPPTLPPAQNALFALRFLKTLY